jgi:hypothetical protein
LDLAVGESEAKRLYLIAPTILMRACILSNRNADIVVEEDLVGNFAKVHGHYFEFMITSFTSI